MSLFAQDIEPNILSNGSERIPNHVMPNDVSVIYNIKKQTKCEKVNRTTKGMKMS